MDSFLIFLDVCMTKKGKFQVSKRTTVTFCYSDFYLLVLELSYQKNVYTAVTELCNFFHDLCARTIRVSELDRLQTDIILILCKLERIFPPAFFSVMVHLVVHLHTKPTLLDQFITVECIQLKEVYTH